MKTIHISTKSQQQSGKPNHKRVKPTKSAVRNKLGLHIFEFLI